MASVPSAVEVGRFAFVAGKTQFIGLETGVTRPHVLTDVDDGRLGYRAPGLSIDLPRGPPLATTTCTAAEGIATTSEACSALSAVEGTIFATDALPFIPSRLPR